MAAYVYLWTEGPNNTGKWIRIGGSNFKVTHAPVTDASATTDSGTFTTFVKSVTQNSNGQINVVKGEMPAVIQLGTTSTTAAAGDHTHGNINNNGTLDNVDGNAAVVTTATGGLTTEDLTVSDPNSANTPYTYINRLSQNARGKITTSASTIPDADASTKGVVKLGAVGGAAAYEDRYTNDKVSTFLGFTANDTSNYLRADGTWNIPPDTTYGAENNGGLSLNNSNEFSIATGGVSTNKIEDGAITTIKIADGAINETKLAGSLSNNALANHSITFGTQTLDLGQTLNVSTFREDLGLASALKFIGTTSSTLTDGSSASPIVIEGESVIPQTGDVVIDSQNVGEYLWTGTRWEHLGQDASFKILQSSYSAPAADSGTTSHTFVSNITQNANGEINATRAYLPQFTLQLGPAADAAYNTATSAEKNEFYINDTTNQTARISPGTDLEFATQGTTTIINHIESGIVVNAQGSAVSTTSTANPGYSGSFDIPKITVNAQGHVTDMDTVTINMPSVPTFQQVATNDTTGILSVSYGGTGSDSGSLNANEVVMTGTAQNNKAFTTRELVHSNAATALSNANIDAIPTVQTVIKGLTKVNNNDPLRSDTTSVYAPTTATGTGTTNTSGFYLKSTSNVPEWEAFPDIPTITLNDTSINAGNKNNVTCSFYAPTSSGTEDDFLVANASGYPVWKTASQLKTIIGDVMYPIGSIYYTTSATNPATFFGGTWERYAQGRMIIGYGTSISDGTTTKSFTTIGGTGGEYNHTITTSEMPSHTHTVSGGSVGYATANHDHYISISINHTHSFSTSTDSASHNHYLYLTSESGGNHRHCLGKHLDKIRSGTNLNSSTNYDDGSTTGYNTSYSGDHTHSVSGYTYNESHSHSISGSVNYTNASYSGYTNYSGSSANHTHSLTGLTLNYSGSGSSMNNLPPYVIVYIWRRTA